MNRTFLIARRELMAYVRTVGFWLSLLSLPLFASLGGVIPMLAMNSEPTRSVAVVEVASGAPLKAGVEARLTARDRERQVDVISALVIPQAGIEASRQVQALGEREGPEAALAEARRIAPTAASGYRPPKADLRLAETPEAVLAAAPGEAREAVVRDLLNAEERTLDAVVLLAREADGPAARVWSAKASDDTVQDAVSTALREITRAERYATLGVGVESVREIDAFRPEVALLSPRSESGGEVSFRDRLPALIGFGFGFLLWALVITGASILLNSVMEEKSNKILEVLLSSASPGEILTGKVLGVALLTLTVMVVWGGLGGAGLVAAAPDVARDIWSIVSRDGLILYFLLYIAGGYLMYAVLFAAVGAFCETPRDAQTLMGPIMMLLVVPILAMQFALRTPDALFVKVLSWIPLFTPFLMSARIPSGGVGPVEIAATTAGMFAMAIFMVWIAGRAFRAGALSDVKLSWKTFGMAVRGGR